MHEKTFEQAVESATGEPIEQIRRTPIAERRESIERARKKRLSFRSWFPFVGRGNVMRDRTVSHEKVEKDFLGAVHGKVEA